MVKSKILSYHQKLYLEQVIWGQHAYLLWLIASCIWGQALIFMERMFFCSYERTDFIQNTNTTILCHRFSNLTMNLQKRWVVIEYNFY